MNMLSKYGIVGFFRLFVSILYTKIRFPQARLLRFPFDIRNRKWIDLGKGLTIGYGCRFEAHPKDTNSNEKCLILGENIECNDYVHIVASVKVVIGNHVLIASKVFITDLNHGQYTGVDCDHPNSIPKDRKLSSNPVIIEDNVWIGENVCIMPGVTIGFGSIIGASSVVTKSIPQNSIAVGTPAKVVKRFDEVNKTWIKV